MKPLELQNYLLEKIGLKKGDEIIIKFGDRNDIYKTEYNEKTKEYYFLSKNKYEHVPFYILLVNEFEIIKKEKNGNLKCFDIDCSDCPFNLFTCQGFYLDSDKSLFDLLKEFKNDNDKNKNEKMKIYNKTLLNYIEIFLNKPIEIKEKNGS